MASLEKQAITLGVKHGFVMLPTRMKFPKGVSKWQKLKKSYSGARWKDATGFSILTGLPSGVTVIDVDAPDRKWFDDFWAHWALPPTTTVETPSGGLHLYYKYDARIKQTQRLGGFDIDVRNDSGHIMAPGSPYEAKGDKAKFNGTLYKLTVPFESMRPMDEIWFEMQTFGVERETFAVKDPKPIEHKPKVVRDATHGEITMPPGNESLFLNLMLALAKNFDNSNDRWTWAVWAICKVAKDNGFDALDMADAWSQRLPKYDSRAAVERIVNRFNYEKSPGLGWVLSKVPANDQARIEFMANFRRQYYFLDHIDLLARPGLMEIKKVHDFLATAMLKVVRSGTPYWYLRYKTNGVDDWALFKGQGNPFKGDNRGKFKYMRTLEGKELEAEIANATKAGREPEQPKLTESSFFNELLEQQYTKIPTYGSIVFKPYYGCTPPNRPDEYNAFTGYRHREYSDEERKKVLEDPVVRKRFELLMHHWKETMCNGDKAFCDYVWNWQSYLLRYGWKKPPTFLVFIGKQGLGKNLCWENLFITGILGDYGHVVQDMKRFQSNFNMKRLNKCLHVFNECTCIQQNNRTNWDMMKSLTELAFTAEPKGKESFRAYDPAGSVFMSNHGQAGGAPVMVENDDRRYAVTDMADTHKGNRKYFSKLADAVDDPRVQRLYFSFLVQRDLSKVNLRNIPDTEMRLALKKNKSMNHVLTFMERVVTLEGFVPWYRELAEEKAWFGKGRVRASFYDYCEATPSRSVSKYGAASKRGWPKRG